MNFYTHLARWAIENYLRSKKKVSASSDLPSEMLRRKAGVFVCLKKDQELRGCIGTFLPTKENLAQEIIDNAISAATCDDRFCPIGHNELEDLKISVDVLSQPEQINSLDCLDPKKYGVIVRTLNGRLGLLLPDLEGVNTPEEQISIASQKGGIDLRIDKIFLYRFSVKRYKDC